MFVAHSPDLQKLYDIDLKDIIVFCTRNYGRWLNEDNLRSINRKKFKHTSKNSEQCAKKFYNYLKEQIEKIDNTIESPAMEALEVEVEIKDDIEDPDGSINSGKIA